MASASRPNASARATVPMSRNSVTLSTTGMSLGKHFVWVRGVDAAGNKGPVSAVFLKIK